MKTSTYAPEQISLIAQNKYTHSVTSTRVVFTLEFKQFFLDQMNQGKTTPQILKDAGYDPAWFPRTTLDSIRKNIRKEAHSETGLQPPRGLNTEEKIAAFAAKDLSHQRTKATLREMQEHIVHLEEQIEFLKKISEIGK